MEYPPSKETSTLLNKRTFTKADVENISRDFKIQIINNRGRRNLVTTDNLLTYVAKETSAQVLPIDSMRSFETEWRNQILTEVRWTPFAYAYNTNPNYRLRSFLHEYNIALLRNQYMARNILRMVELYPEAEIIVLMGILHRSVFYDLVYENNKLFSGTTVYDPVTYNRSVLSPFALFQLYDYVVSHSGRELFHLPLPTKYFLPHKVGISPKIGHYDYGVQGPHGENVIANEKFKEECQPFKKQMKDMEDAWETIRLKEQITSEDVDRLVFYKTIIAAKSGAYGSQFPAFGKIRG
jgi:hypothetical protein